MKIDQLLKYVLFMPLALYGVLLGCGGSSGSGDANNSPGSVETIHIPQWVVFRADKEVDEVYELYSVLDNGSIDPIKLSPTTKVASVESYWVSPDGARVAFTAEEDADSNGMIDAADGPAELYWVDIDGSSPAEKISGELPAHAGILAVDWSPNSNQLVFRSDIDTDDVDELYLVTGGSNTLVKINGDVSDTVEMGAAFWSPDGRYIAQVVRNRKNTRYTDRVGINVYDTTLGVPNSVRLTGPNLVGFYWGPNNQTMGVSIESVITWSPDSSRIAYSILDWDTDTTLNYQAFPDGTHERVTETLSADDSGNWQISWSDDGRYLAYLIYREGVGLNSIGVFDSTTSDAKRIVTAPSSGRIYNHSWQPDGTDMAVMMSRSETGPPELFLISAEDNGSAVPAPMVTESDPDRYISEFEWSPFGDLLSYRIRDKSTSTLAIFTLDPYSNLPPMAISQPQVKYIQYDRVQWLPTNDLLFYSAGDGYYVADADEPDTYQQVSGGLNIKIATQVQGFTYHIGSASTLYTDPGLQIIAMILERPGTNTYALYTVRPDGSELKEVSGDMVAEGDVASFAFGRSSET